MTAMYRTLVRGKLQQLSSLCVGGSPAQPGVADVQCARDGQNRLTIPGTALAGCLIEAAGRVFPELLRRGADRQLKKRLWEAITAKSDSAPPEEILQSLWRFWPACRSRKQTELRQGVGIRQETGAAATEARALYDVETIPPGETWDFFLEIDTLRGKERLEAAALYALLEWMCGRCWLGAAAARGLGWMQLKQVEALRLPLTEQAINAWPDNTCFLEDMWPRLAGLDQVDRVTDEAALRRWAAQLWDKMETLPDDRFYYVVLTGTVSAGPARSGYGWDVLSVGGHAAGTLKPLDQNLLGPLGVEPADWQATYDPDAPVVTSGPDEDMQRPLIPGSGVRGPLRHAASRWQRGCRVEVVDPNVNVPGGDRRAETSPDPVAELFGLTGQSGRLLVRDARLTEGSRSRLAWLQHHAEDEFAGGVYGTGKFDRTAVIDGEFEVRLVIEAQDRKALVKSLETLGPALRLAELGFVPLGGAKQRGAGGGCWTFTEGWFGRAGDAPPTQPPKLRDSVVPFLQGLAGQLRKGDEHAVQ
jgi:CRISPR/Cas system CSM-associated protein Csm3 (group 7 of RAMP superfamily)